MTSASESLATDRMNGNLSYCVKCRGNLLRDQNSGEVVCQKCGLVLLEYNVDASPNRWAKSGEFSQEYQLTPTTVSLADYGISGEISASRRDSHGKYLSQRDGIDATRLAKWHRRIKASSSDQKILTAALARISEVCGVLQLPRSVAEEAAWICRKSLKVGSLAGKSSKGISIASIYMACRKLGVDRSIKQVAEAASLSHRVVWKYYGMLSNELTGSVVPHRSIKTYISKLANTSKIDPRIERLALQIATTTEAEMIPTGGVPLGVAAAHIYIASVFSGGFIPEQEIAESADITDVTLRIRCREILEQFTIKQKLRSRN